MNKRQLVRAAAPGTRSTPKNLTLGLTGDEEWHQVCYCSPSLSSKIMKPPLINTDMGQKNKENSILPPFFLK